MIREEDGELALAAHTEAFWNFASVKELMQAITELIFIPDHIKDGQYLPESTDESSISEQQIASPSRQCFFLYKKITTGVSHPVMLSNGRIGILVPLTHPQYTY